MSALTRNTDLAELGCHVNDPKTTCFGGPNNKIIGCLFVYGRCQKPNYLVLYLSVTYYLGKNWRTCNFLLQSAEESSEGIVDASSQETMVVMIQLLPLREFFGRTTVGTREEFSG